MPSPSRRAPARKLLTKQDFVDVYLTDETERRRGLSARRLYEWARQPEQGYGPHIGTKTQLQALFPKERSKGPGRLQRMSEPQPPTGPVTDTSLSGSGTAEDPLVVAVIDGGTF
jgi:hypothetical protein